MPDTYIHDGISFRKLKGMAVYVPGGFAVQCRKVYCHDGTTWRLVFQAGQWEQITSVLPSDGDFTNMAATNGRLVITGYSTETAKSGVWQFDGTTAVKMTGGYSTIKASKVIAIGSSAYVLANGFTSDGTDNILLASDGSTVLTAYNNPAVIHSFWDLYDHNGAPAGSSFNTASVPARQIWTNIAATPTLVAPLSPYEPGTKYRLYVGGLLWSVGGYLSTNRMYVWNGSAWSQDNSGLPLSLYCTHLTMYNGYIHCLSGHNIYRRDGSSWASFGDFTDATDFIGLWNTDMVSANTVEPGINLCNGTTFSPIGVGDLQVVTSGTIQTATFGGYLYALTRYALWRWVPQP